MVYFPIKVQMRKLVEDKSDTSTRKNDLGLTRNIPDHKTNSLIKILDDSQY